MSENMATTQEGSNEVGNTSKRESGRRSWTPQEEETLLAALKELVVNGWKSDNGFRPGFGSKLAEAMKKKFPNANIKASPHITSRITAWKRAYASIMNALSRSGVGYNLNGDHKIDCDNKQWEEIIKADSYAKNIRDKSFPLLDGWMEVFGKDRATGDGAEDVMEVVNELIAEHDAPESHPGKRAHSSDPNDKGPTQTTDASVCDSPQKKFKSSGNSKKHKAEDGMQNFCELLREMHQDTNERLKTIAHRIGYQADLGQARKDVFTLLQKIPNLSLDDQFDAGDILVKEPERLEYFIGLPEEARSAYVYRLLHAPK